MEITFFLATVIVLMAFLCEYTDSTLGMGYGTTLSPMLLLMGFEPLQVVPVVLLSELVTGMLAGIFHHNEGNVNFRDVNVRKIVSVFAGAGVIGTLMAVVIALNIPKTYLQIYIGILVTGLGIFMLATRGRPFSFSWKKIIAVGTLASFNKGISGGGYGPLVCSGQVLSGVQAKSAAAITSVAESFTCLVSILAYFLIAHKDVNWQLAPYIIGGAVLSVPLSAKSVKWIKEDKFTLFIAFATLALGIFCLAKTIWG